MALILRTTGEAVAHVSFIMGKCIAYAQEQSRTHSWLAVPNGN